MYYKVIATRKEEITEDRDYARVYSLGKYTAKGKPGRRKFDDYGNEYFTGIYLADDDEIMRFCDCGDSIADVVLPDDAHYVTTYLDEIVSDAIEIVRIRPLWTEETIEQLEEEGVDIMKDDFVFLTYAVQRGMTDLVRYLLSTYGRYISQSAFGLCMCLAEEYENETMIELLNSADIPWKVKENDNGN